MHLLAFSDKQFSKILKIPFAPVVEEIHLVVLEKLTL